MRHKRSWLVLIILLYIAVGDLLPGPVGQWSTQTRNWLNARIIGVFPRWDPRLNPNQRTQQQLDRYESNQEPRS